jgi:tryptophanyl-tRNA synthetase
MSKPRILSGMRASNERLHLGNYEGALRVWIELQNNYEMFCMVADWHSLTTLRAGQAFDVGRNSLEIAKDYVAAGLDPEKCAIFIQSHVPEHAELHLALSMVAGLGKLERVPTFKEKKDDLGAEQQVSYGLLGYPVLQAADILLYKPYGVPVGKDQAPHLEVSREIGRSFNAMFGVEVFSEFVNIIDEDELRSKLPGLDADENGVLRKMSKSYDNCIYLSDSEKNVQKKVSMMITDPARVKRTDVGHPEVCSVCAYQTVFNPEEAEQLHEGCRTASIGCTDCKKRLAEKINELLEPMREKRAGLEKKPKEIDDIIKEGNKKARAFAQETMKEVRKALNLP